MTNMILSRKVSSNSMACLRKAVVGCVVLLAWGLQDVDAAQVVSAARTESAGSKGVAWHTTTKFLTDSASQMSVVVWTKNCTAVNMLRLVEQAGQFNIQCPNGSSTVRFYVTPQNGSAISVNADANKLSRAVLNDGSWHCVSATFKYDATDASSSFLRIYCDGQLAGELTGTTITGPLSAPTQGFTIGGQWASGGYADWRIAGRFAEVTLWDRALTSEEIASLACRRPWRGEEGLVGYWLPADSETRANCAKGGVTAGLSISASSYTLGYVEDLDFPCGNEYYVASDAWAQAHPAYDPTGKSYRSWDEPALIDQAQEIMDLAIAPPIVVFGEGTFKPSNEITITRTDGVRLKRFNSDELTIDEDRVVLDGQNARRILKIAPTAKDADIEINGLTFVNGNGSGESGGAVYVDLNGASSSAASRGKRCRLVNCVFKNNTALASGGNGGAVHLRGGFVSNCVFTANAALRNGGAVCCAGKPSYDNSSATLSSEAEVPAVFDSTFTSNTAWRGGAVADSNDGSGGWQSYLVRGCSFDQNTTSGTALSNSRGGQVALARASVLADSTFTGESEASYGSCVDWQKGGVLVSHCTFTGMEIKTGYGVIHSGQDNSIIERCIFTNNTFGIDAVFSESTAKLTLRNCLFADNALPSVRTIVACHNATQVVMENCTLADNTHASTIYPFRRNAGSPQCVCVNSICLDRALTLDGGSLTVTNSCVVAPAPGGALDTGVITGVPRFADAQHGDYSLAGALCRDRGVVLPWMSASAIDLAGNPRVVTNGESLMTDPAALPDLGCLEFQDRQPGLIIIFR